MRRPAVIAAGTSRAVTGAYREPMYSALLRDLDRAFNGSPRIIGDVIDAMGDLTASARATLDVPSGAGRRPASASNMCPSIRSLP